MLLKGRGVWLRGWSRRGSVGVGVGADGRVFGGWEGFEEGCLCRFSGARLWSGSRMARGSAGDCVGLLDYWSEALWGI